MDGVKGDYPSIKELVDNYRTMAGYSTLLDDLRDSVRIQQLLKN